MATHDLKPLITFCIPFYKGLPYLKQAIDSVVRQSRPDWKCLVIDDAGPETETELLIKTFQDPRIFYSRNDQNLGLAGNWNRCIGLATTPYVTLLHADDRLAPHYLAEVLFSFAKYPEATAIFCRARIINDQGDPAFSFADRFKNILMPSTDRCIVLEGEVGLRALMKGNFVFCPSLCYRKSKISAVPFKTQWRMVIDLDWLVDALFCGNQLVGIPSVAYEYRRHLENQTSILTRSKIRFHEEIAIHHIVAGRCLTRGWPKAAKAAKIMLSIRLHILYHIFQSCLRFKFRDVWDLGVIFLKSRDPKAYQAMMGA